MDPITQIGNRDFDLLSPGSGWVLLGTRLYWTDSSGEIWQDITPPGFSLLGPRAVAFLDSQQGWVVETEHDERHGFRYSLARTADGGENWQRWEIELFPVGDVASLAQSLSLFVLDSETGWLVVRHASSANFNEGTLFRTEDGGKTWERLHIPIGEPVFFLTRDVGWVAGGVNGTELYQTRDGGQTWIPERLPGMQNEHPRRCELPQFINAREGVLLAQSGKTLEFYSTKDGGLHWHLVATQVNGGDSVTSSPMPWVLSSSDQALVFTTRMRHQIRWDVFAGLSATVSNLDVPGNILALRMATADSGWAFYQNGFCAVDGMACRQDSGLLQTRDGGQSWIDLALPLPVEPRIVKVSPVPEQTHLVEEELVQPFVGHGFDICEIPSLATLQNWSTQSPYRTINLYIGGSSRGCGNAALTAEYLEQLSQQGWKFIPTWVGPQAACTSYGSRMSYDAAVAHAQGVQEAQAALTTAAILGLAHPDRSDALIYYDLEAYDTSNTPCREAAEAFIYGWSMQLQAHNNQAGLYGSSCASGLSYYTDLPHVPDVIWPAHWIYSSFNSEASVWGVACLSDTVWSNQQRIRQYAGDHQETWGGITLSIDSNVLDGRVSTIGTATQTYIVEPALHPAPGSTCGAPGEPATGWYPLPVYAGHQAYATLNATTAEQSTNSASWDLPLLPCRTLYAVEALIVNHPQIVWCEGQTLTGDTNYAQYLIQHAQGITEIALDQRPLADAWAWLGVYEFDPAVPGGVVLDTVTGELLGTTSISFSAIRFTPVTTCMTSTTTSHIYFTPTVVNADAHAPVTVTLMISNVVNLGAFDYLISFDPAVVTATQVTVGQFIGSTNRIVTPLGPIIDNVNGTVNFGAFSQGEALGPSGNGVLAYIRFQAQSSGETPLHFANHSTLDIEGALLPTTASDGHITVVACLGDFNADGQIDISDIQTIAGRWRIRHTDPLYETRFDLNGNGEIDISDIQTVASRWLVVCAVVNSSGMAPMP
ncbi:MAG: DUF1906 domain-containing protein [Anaerolineae bacterium]|nr:DUF1906 domain-containing protein [Anaerolineae bacterium]